MNVYVYQAALYCEDCGEAIISNLKSLRIKDHGDSDSFPQGTYPEGGGEADTPQHCADCSLFLENDLTPEGEEYVMQTIEAHDNAGDRSSETLKIWREFYNI